MTTTIHDNNPLTTEALRIGLIDPARRPVGEASLKLHQSPASSSRTQPLVSVELDAQGRHFKGLGNDYYEALQQLRRQLLPHGLDLDCYGSCVNVAPSLASRERTHGRLACTLKLGQEPREDALVDIFAHPTDSLPLGSPDEQHKFLADWRLSLVRVFKFARIRISDLATQRATELLLADFMKSQVVRKEYQFDDLQEEMTLRVHNQLIRSILDDLEPHKLSDLPCRRTRGAQDDQVFHIQLVDQQGSTAHDLKNPQRGKENPNVIDRILEIADGSEWKLFIRSWLPARCTRGGAS